MGNNFILKGNICHTPGPEKLEIYENAYAVCTDGRCEGIFEQVPAAFAGYERIDCGDQLVIPGLVDLHIHAPQFVFRGTGMDEELLVWLDTHTFPEEARFADSGYARKAYEIFASAMTKSATTRAVIFGTMHRESTLILADFMEKTGLITFVGKVNMDSCSLPELSESSAQEAAEDTRRYISQMRERRYQRTRPILTPRFIPACSEQLLEELGNIQKDYDLPVQSHLSENPDEVKLVSELMPFSAFYGDAYDHFGLFGRGAPTIMAHCVYSTPEEKRRILENGVWVAHCPSSNMNLASGIAPMRDYLRMGVRAGLGTDVAAGTSESMFAVVTEAIQVSKLYWRYIDREADPLTFSESFFLATKGGGSFFGKAGSFEKGYAFDALVIDDSVQLSPRPLPVGERLERAFYQGLDRNGITMKIAEGRRVI